jgi:hypothetical protein
LEGNIACVGGKYATASERAQGTEEDDGVRATNVPLVCAAGAIALYAVGGLALGYAQGRGRSLPNGLGLVERLVGTHVHARQLWELRGLVMDGVGMVTGGRFGGGGKGGKGATGAPLLSDSPGKNRRASTDSAVSSSSRKSSKGSKGSKSSKGAKGSTDPSELVLERLSSAAASLRRSQSQAPAAALKAGEQEQASQKPSQEEEEEPQPASSPDPAVQLSFSAACGSDSSDDDDDDDSRCSVVFHEGNNNLDASTNMDRTDAVR